MGPLATQSELLLGNYYGPPAGQLLTPFEAVRQRVDRYNAKYQRSVGTNFVRGCDVVGSGEGGWTHVHVHKCAGAWVRGCRC